jgi:hypothetical protein
MQQEVRSPFESDGFRSIAQLVQAALREQTGREPSGEEVNERVMSIMSKPDVSPGNAGR